jgi:hypothetical protein
MEWLTETEVVAYGGLSVSALRSRRRRKTIPAKRGDDGKSWLYKKGPWLLATVRFSHPVAEQVVEEQSEEVKESLFPQQPVVPEVEETQSMEWLIQTLRSMPEQEALSFVRKMILSHPGTPPEVRVLITEFWGGTL